MTVFPPHPSRPARLLSHCSLFSLRNKTRNQHYYHIVSTISTMISVKAKALALIPKATGGLSLCGSLFILQDILFCSDTKRKRSVYHRIMLGLSLFDSMSSLVNIASTWPTPAFLADQVYLAAGTTATCVAQGFFNELGNITTVLYTASLTVRYLLFVCFGVREHELKRHEVFFHGIPISVGLIMGVVGLPLQLYNNSGWLCWYAPYPAGCTADKSCTRGELAPTFRWIHYAIVWTAILFVTFSMIFIYITVRRQEVRSRQILGLQCKSEKWHSIGLAMKRRNSFGCSVSSSQLFDMDTSSVSPLDLGSSSIEAPRLKRKYRLSRDVATQARLYIYALYLTWLFTTITRLIQTFRYESWYPSLLLMAIFFPLQGFWNCCIYIRPTLIQKRREQKRHARRRSKIKEQSMDKFSSAALRIASLDPNSDEEQDMFKVLAERVSDTTATRREAADMEEPSNVPRV